MTIIKVIHVVPTVAIYTFLLLQLTGNWCSDNMARVTIKRKVLNFEEKLRWQEK
jgi:hypothetical protein